MWLSCGDNCSKFFCIGYIHRCKFAFDLRYIIFTGFLFCEFQYFVWAKKMNEKNNHFWQNTLLSNGTGSDRKIKVLSTRQYKRNRWIGLSSPDKNHLIFYIKKIFPFTKKYILLHRNLYSKHHLSSCYICFSFIIFVLFFSVIIWESEQIFDWWFSCVFETVGATISSCLNISK